MKTIIWSGTVPPQLGKLTNLNVWYLSGNRLNGCLPADWQGATANDFDDLGLIFCIAPSSPLTVAIDRDALIALYRDTDGDHWTYNDNWLSDAPLNTWYGVGTDENGRVTYLDLRENGLRGEIPPELGNLINLEWVDLAENQLRGTIPAEMGNLTNLQELYLDSNQLQGTIPAKFNNLTNLVELSLLGNQLIGCAPAAWRNGVGSDLEILGLPYCAAPSSPLLVAADREALITLYRSTNGGYWFNNRNWLSDAPLNTWHGVTTDDSGRVTKLELGYNGLSGTIPSELGTLRHLERLLLHGNALHGEIPTELGNLANLTSLSFSENQLHGTIPPVLGNLTNLAGLYLDSNQLHGTVPPELGNLTNLAVLWLDSNQLHGTVPSELGNLTNLLGLRLSGNQLSGCVSAAWRNVVESDLERVGLPYCAAP